MNAATPAAPLRRILVRFVPPLVLMAVALGVLATGSNARLFLSVHRALLPLGSAFWSGVTLLGDALVAPLLLLPFLRRKPSLLWAGTLAAVLATLFTHVLKALVGMPRPAALLDIQVFGPRLLAGSFPSGHTATAFTVLALLLLAGQLPGAGRLLPALLLACLVGLSRIAVGAHWPADVLAGAAGGWLSAVLALALAARWPQGGRGRMMLAQYALLGGLAVVDLFGHDTGYADGILLQRVLGGAALVWMIWTWSRADTRPAR